MVKASVISGAGIGLDQINILKAFEGKTATYFTYTPKYKDSNINPIITLALGCNHAKAILINYMVNSLHTADKV